MTDRARGRRRPAAAPVGREEIVSVDTLALGGQGMGRLSDGRAMFVPGAFPGDRIALRTVRLKKSFAEAVDWELLSSSPLRVKPRCVDAERCGGCGLMGLSEAAQGEAKVQFVREALERVGGFRGDPVLREIRLIAGEPFEYRQRLRLQVRGRRLGFFAARSHELVEVARCHLVSSELWTAVRLLQEFLRDHAPLPHCQGVEVRLLGGEKRASAYFYGTPGREREFIAGLERAREQLSPGVDVFSNAEGTGSLAVERLELGEGVFSLAAPGAFVQVNPKINRLMVREVLEFAGPLQATEALDLFCGLGNFSLPLAGLQVSVLGVEHAGLALEGARQAAALQALPALFRSGDAHAVASELSRAGRRFDLVVVDPPRAGAKGMASDLKRLTRKALVMVSCDPATLARDLRALVSEGFELTSVTAFDMFPQTPHVETMCILTPR